MVEVPVSASLEDTLPFRALPSTLFGRTRSDEELATLPRAERGSLGLTSLSCEVLQAPQLWLRACAICGSSRCSMLDWQTTRSARASRSAKRPFRPCLTNHVQAIQALDPCSQ